MVPPGGPVFGPFILSDVLKFCKLLCAQNVKLEATDTNSIRGRTLELFEALVAEKVAMMCALMFVASTLAMYRGSCFQRFSDLSITIGAASAASPRPLLLMSSCYDV